MNNLKWLREEHGLSLREVSSLTGITFAMVSNLENEKKSFRQWHIKALVSLFDVTSDFLLGNSDFGICVWEYDNHGAQTIDKSLWKEYKDKIDITLTMDTGNEYFLTNKHKQMTIKKLDDQKSKYCRIERRFKPDFKFTLTYKEALIHMLKGGEIDETKAEKIFRFINDYILK